MIATSNDLRRLHTMEEFAAANLLASELIALCAKPQRGRGHYADFGRQRGLSRHQVYRMRKRLGLIEMCKSG